MGQNTESLAWWSMELRHRFKLSLMCSRAAPESSALLCCWGYIYLYIENTYIKKQNRAASSSPYWCNLTLVCKRINVCVKLLQCTKNEAKCEGRLDFIHPSASAAHSWISKQPFSSNYQQNMTLTPTTTSMAGGYLLEFSSHHEEEKRRNRTRSHDGQIQLFIWEILQMLL